MRYCVRILEYIRCDILLVIFGYVQYSKYDMCLSVIYTNQHSKGVIFYMHILLRHDMHL